MQVLTSVPNQNLAAANLGRLAGARAARSQQSITWRQSAITVTTGNAFAEHFAGISEGWRAHRRPKQAGRTESSALGATAPKKTARGLSRLPTDPVEEVCLKGLIPPAHIENATREFRPSHNRDDRF